jgi:hypothetical protein
VSTPRIKAGSPVPPAPAAPAGGLPGPLKGKEKPALIAAAALVAGLALLRRHNAAGDTAPDSPAAAQQFAGQGGGVYDSSSSDVYNALQPQIEQTQSMLEQLLDRLNPSTPPATTPPVVSPPPGRGGTPPVVTVPGPVKSLPPRIPTPRVPVQSAPKPKPGARKPIPGPVKAPSSSVYVVKKGDTLSAIAHRFGTSWSAIYRDNRGVIGANPDLILPGQKLTVKRK